MPGNEQRGYLPTDGAHLYTTIHTPPGGNTRGPLLLILPAFGEERKSAHRMLVLLAREAAARGYTAVRFDLRGTGESTGEHAGATLAAWGTDAENLLATLSSPLESSGWLAVGARLGANLAVRLAAKTAPGRLILLEPIVTGADYLRDLERRRQIQHVLGTPAASPGTPEHASRPSDSTDFGGYAVGQTMLDELRNLSLLADLESVRQPCSVHVLRISGSSRFPASWQPVVARLGMMPGSEAKILREKPFWGQLDYHESRGILAELTRLLPGNRKCP